MPPEGYEEALREAQQKAYEQAQQSQQGSRVIDCGKLVEVNGTYVPAK